VLFLNAISTPNAQLSWTVLFSVSVRLSARYSLTLSAAATATHILTSVRCKYSPAKLELASLLSSKDSVVRRSNRVSSHLVVILKCDHISSLKGVSLSVFLLS